MTFKQLIKKYEIKQEYIASVLKMNQCSISLWCLGKRTPKIEIIPKLEKIIGCERLELINAFLEARNEK